MVVWSGRLSKPNPKFTLTSCGSRYFTIHLVPVGQSLHFWNWPWMLPATRPHTAVEWGTWQWRRWAREKRFRIYTIFKSNTNSLAIFLLPPHYETSVQIVEHTIREYRCITNITFNLMQLCNSGSLGWRALMAEQTRCFNLGEGGS